MENKSEKINIENMREEIDYMEVFNLSKRITELANEASALSQKLINGNLSDTKKEEIGEKLKEVVEEGYTLARDRIKIFARHDKE